MMCATYLTALLLLAAAARADEAFITQEFVDEINAIPGITWTATTKNGPRVDGASEEQIRGLMGVRGTGTRLDGRVFDDDELSTEIPESFDAAEHWPDCSTITRIRDQSACGSCWANAAAESMSDRYCTMGINYNLSISAANLMECCFSCGFGCQGGDPDSAWEYWVNYGLLSDTCQPYPFMKCKHHTNKGPYPPCPASLYPTPPCLDGCVPGAKSTGTRHRGRTAYSLSGEHAFKLELMTRGPFEVTMTVYKDFVAYTGGVYQHKTGKALGGHAIKVVGWGSLNGVPYWKIANSWNKYWGMNGYFLILRGKDECGIEDGGSAGTPLF